MPFSVYIRDLAFYLLGAAIVRGAACTVNDIMDRGFDAQVGKSFPFLNLARFITILRKNQGKTVAQRKSHGICGVHIPRDAICSSCHVFFRLEEHRVSHLQLSRRTFNPSTAF